jgi:hypothetical protein
MTISNLPSVVAVTFNSMQTTAATSPTKGTNSVTVHFAPLTAWGTVQATLYYIDSTGALKPPRAGTVATFGTETLAVFGWSGDVLKQVDHVVLTAQIGGQTVTIYNSAQPATTQPYSRILTWNESAVADSSASLTYQPSDLSAPPITVGTAAGSVQNTGTNYFVDISGLTDGKTYNYQINYTLPGASRPYATANGAFVNTGGASGVAASANSFKPAFDAKQVHYNAFGDIDRKGLNGAGQEYFDYDAAGRLWRTNQDDGVDKVMLYNLQGQATSKIQSQTFDLHSLTTASDVLTVARDAGDPPDVHVDAAARFDQSNADGRGILGDPGADRSQ